MVILTGALLAESASVVDNKLNIQGGVVSSFRAGPSRVAVATLVVLIQPEPLDQTATINLTLADPAGESQPFSFEVPKSSLGGEIGFAYFPLRIAVPVDGRYLLAVSARSGSVTLPLTVTT